MATWSSGFISFDILTVNVLLLASPDITQFRMRGSLQSYSLSEMNKDLPIKPEGEMIDLEGPPGELALVLTLQLPNLRHREVMGLLLSPAAGSAGQGLAPSPQFLPGWPSPRRGHGGALAWGWGSTLFSLESSWLLKPCPDSRFQCLSFRTTLGPLSAFIAMWGERKCRQLGS